MVEQRQRPRSAYRDAIWRDVNAIQWTEKKSDKICSKNIQRTPIDTARLWMHRVKRRKKKQKLHCNFATLSCTRKCSIFTFFLPLISLLQPKTVFRVSLTSSTSLACNNFSLSLFLFSCGFHRSSCAIESAVDFSSRDCDLHWIRLIILMYLCFFSLSQFAAVRYGRVPKRTRDIVGSTDDTTAVTNGAGLNLNASTIRIVSCTSSTAAVTAAIVTTTSNSSSSTPTANNSAAKLNSSSSSGGGGNLILVSSPQMCSTTSTTPIEYISSDMIEASHMSNNNNNNNISDDNQELSVYDVILCVAQAHRAHCNFTESAIKALNLNPLNMPNNHHMTSNQTSIISTSNLITSTTTNSNNSTTQDSSMSDDSGVSWHAVSVINSRYQKSVSFQGRHICRRDDRASASLSMATICNSHDSHRTASRWVRKKGEQTTAHAHVWAVM